MWVNRFLVVLISAIHMFSTVEIKFRVRVYLFKHCRDNFWNPMIMNDLLV